MIEITEKPINIPLVIKSVASEGAGAVVPFIGTVRRERGLTGLFYECYPEMAAKVLKEIADEAKRKWPIAVVSVVHRYGWIEVGEASIVIAVALAHRKEAFEACRFLIDRIKEIAPIWKIEGGERVACC
jgi:molybdopterin synthase catalytic subunit